MGGGKTQPSGFSGSQFIINLQRPVQDLRRQTGVDELKVSSFRGKTPVDFLSNVHGKLDVHSACVKFPTLRCVQ